MGEVDCAQTNSARTTAMDATRNSETRQHRHDARTLPAPPAALWTFALIFTLSAVVALAN